MKKSSTYSILGNDYSTRDGTGIRDYIHVVDLAKGHVVAVKYVLSILPLNCRYLKDKNPGCVIYNLGTGKGKTVLEVIEAFKKASKKDIPYTIVARRPGDVTILEANVDKVYKELGWKAELGLDEMCEDSWRWQSQNPDGYETN